MDYLLGILFEEQFLQINVRIEKVIYLDSLILTKQLSIKKTCSKTGKGLGYGLIFP